MLKNHGRGRDVNTSTQQQRQKCRYRTSGKLKKKQFTTNQSWNETVAYLCEVRSRATTESLAVFSLMQFFLEYVNTIFASDAHCHKSWVRKYILNYEREVEKDGDEKTVGMKA